MGSELAVAIQAWAAQQQVYSTVHWAPVPLGTVLQPVHSTVHCASCFNRCFHCALGTGSTEHCVAIGHSTAHWAPVPLGTVLQPVHCTVHWAPVPLGTVLQPVHSTVHCVATGAFHSLLVIIYHDFLPTPRRGSHVKSGKTHTQSSRYTP